ncbi:prepilin peptidase [Sphingomonas montanisoli]|uniref:Prepilin leader peptidase/N-methyltransferase n=1 Tax=Sphingomonas montanisoli TaxID=2606412 RepID=A0A5D9CBI2_9SPHN|nr:A24 family peptidase [Sphingomonas montanisoli]TZG27425.1 prepilin peptidase [Sphingomonas montanisoli]
MTEPLLVLFGAVLGGVIGSFLATLILRWPAGRSVARGRSACDGCGAPIDPLRLVPVLSFAVARGRAGCCGTPIDPLHPTVEVGAALIGAVAFAIAPPVDAASGALFGWFLLTLALLDRRHFWLPDRLTLSLLALGLAGGAVGVGPPLADRLIGATGAYVALEAVRRIYARVRGREGLGRGDAKLFAAIGAWLGWQVLPIVLLLASLIGLGVVLALTIMRRPPGRTARLPLGTFLCIAAWIVWGTTACIATLWRSQI